MMACQNSKSIAPALEQSLTVCSAQLQALARALVDLSRENEMSVIAVADMASFFEVPTADVTMPKCPRSLANVLSFFPVFFCKIS